MYGIVAEKLTPLARADFRLVEILSYVFYGTDITNKTEVAQQLQKAKQKNIPLSDQEIRQLNLFSKALADRTIVWGYDFHEENIMMRGRTLVISEFGGGNSPPKRIPQIQWVPL